MMDAHNFIGLTKELASNSAEIPRLYDKILIHVQESCISAINNQICGQCNGNYCTVQTTLLHVAHTEVFWTPDDALRSACTAVFCALIKAIKHVQLSTPLFAVAFSGKAPTLRAFLDKLEIPVLEFPMQFQLNGFSLKELEQAFRGRGFPSPTEDVIEMIWTELNGPLELFDFFKTSLTGPTAEEVSLVIDTATGKFITKINDRVKKVFARYSPSIQNTFSSIQQCVEIVLILALVPELFGGNRMKTTTTFGTGQFSHIFDFLSVCGLLRFRREGRIIAVSNPYPALIRFFSSLMPPTFLCSMLRQTIWLFIALFVS